MHTHKHTHELSYLRSFWLIKPWPNWSTTVLNIALASLAKSRSLISITGTETMAKASLSSLVGHVPNCRRTGDKREVDFTSRHIWNSRSSISETHHEPDGSLLINVDGNIGALDPGVGAEVSQTYVGVSGRQWLSYCAHSCSTTDHVGDDCAVVNLYRGTKESVFCSVVGSSSNNEAMSLP